MSERMSSATNIEHPAPHRHRVGLLALGFGLVGAPLAWNIELLVGTALSGHQCYPRYLPLAVPLWTGTGAVLLAMSLVALALGVAATLVSWRCWMRTRDEKPAGAAFGGNGRTRFLALSGLLTSGLFLVALVFTIAAVVLVPLCSH
jgi:hypothetical protein